MVRTKKARGGRLAKGKSGGSFDPSHDESEESLPSDEAGRLKIKNNYEDLLGIRVEKLRGQVLNREKINKSIEGIYFVCALCKKVCHNFDEGLVQDEETKAHLCSACAKPKRKRGHAA
jgi:hypothetical protein